MRAFAVFSADQADWDTVAPSYEKGELRTDTEVIAEAEALMTGYLGGSNAPSLAYGGDRAYYSPSRDGIQLPERGAFTTDIAFYATAYHEMAHSTGHKSRLAREGVVESHYFGSATYSEEELVAELTSAFLCAETGVLPSTIENSTAYIKGWLSVLKSDPKILIRASSRAEKATNLILGKTTTPTEEEE
jgi:antirestriction protein ArdC